MEKLFVGKVVTTHGIKGEIKILSDFQFKDKVFSVGNKLIINTVNIIITIIFLFFCFKIIAAQITNQAKVLLWLSINVGLPTFAITLAMVNVLPEPVTPSRTCAGTPSCTPSVSCLIACGWSPVG